jgi:hypothetical protein
METKDPQGMKIPLIVLGAAVLVIGAGILVRSGNSPASKSAPVPVPALASEPSAEAGQQFSFASLVATDANGGNWTLGLAGVAPHVRENGKKPGTPLSVRADVQGDGPRISIGLIIEGAAGELYQPYALNNGRIMSAPTFNVIDEAGAIIGSGSFEYG